MTPVNRFDRIDVVIGRITALFGAVANETQVGVDPDEDLGRVRDDGARTCGGASRAERGPARRRRGEIVSVVDLRARRAAEPTDRRTVIDAIVDRTETLLATVSSMPLQVVTETHVISVERHLVALSVLLAELRQRTPNPGSW